MQIIEKMRLFIVLVCPIALISLTSLLTCCLGNRAFPPTNRTIQVVKFSKPSHSSNKSSYIQQFLPPKSIRKHVISLPKHKLRPIVAKRHRFQAQAAQPRYTNVLVSTNNTIENRTACSLRAGTNATNSEEDRLVFLIPLIIIWWHHRHPNERLELDDIRYILKDLETGPDSLSLNEKIACLKLEKDYALTNYLKEKSVSFNEKLRESENFLASLWNEFEVPTNSTATELPDPDARKSGAREIRQWFDALLQVTPVRTNIDKRADKNWAKLRPQSQSITTTTTTTSTTTPAPALSTVQPLETTITNSYRQDEDIATSTIAAPSTTEEPFGWPHHENRTGTSTRRPNQLSEPMEPVELTTLKLTTETTTVDEARQRQPQEEPVATVSTTNELVTTSALTLEQTPTQRLQHSEFLNIVSSILVDIDQMFSNSTAIIEAP